MSSKEFATSATNVQVGCSPLADPTGRLFQILHLILTLIDYDLCQSCMTYGYAQAHSPTHTFQEIHRPVRAQTAPALTNWEHNRPPEKPRWHTLPATATSPEMIVIPKSDVPPAMKLIASCTFCKQFITADRYVSLNAHTPLRCSELIRHNFARNACNALTSTLVDLVSSMSSVLPNLFVQRPTSCPYSGFILIPSFACRPPSLIL